MNARQELLDLLDASGVDPNSASALAKDFMRMAADLATVNNNLTSKQVVELLRNEGQWPVEKDVLWMDAEQTTLSPMLCAHPVKIQICEREGKSAYICQHCGLFTIGNDGERFEFALSTDEQLKAAGQWIRHLVRTEERLMAGEFLKYHDYEKYSPLTVYFVKLSDGSILNAVRSMGEWEDMDGKPLTTVVAWAYSKCIAVEPQYSKS